MEILSKLKPEKKRQEITSFSCNLDVKEKLWVIADANDVTLSDVIRFGLESWLKSLEK